ncbi:hypothetical protein ACGFYV_04595 [Streptomyces sp. NPDC048297]|uniref:hypothetical protein n=1 Tax=Streptomyces sp. NPDC048297 TaxID=3365531 RepID=UPI00371058D4
MGEAPDAGRKRFDLSVPQVAGSALAAVVAAKLASTFGVYGTILGAGVVSVVATCGGSVLQHFFRRTGEQIRDASAAGRPTGDTRKGHEVPAEMHGVTAAGHGASAAGEFGEGTVYRARVKSWKRPVLAAAVVFGVTMAGITTYELASGSSFSGGRGTTVSDAVGGKGRSAPRPGADSGSDSGDTGPSWSPSPTPREGGAPAGDGASTGAATPAPGDSPSGLPSGSDGGRPSGAPATATPSPGASTATPTSPEPSASSRSGTPVPGRGGSATP